MSNKSPNNKELELTKKEFVKVDVRTYVRTYVRTALDEAV